MHCQDRLGAEVPKGQPPTPPDAKQWLEQVGAEASACPGDAQPGRSLRMWRTQPLHIACRSGCSLNLQAGGCLASLDAAQSRPATRRLTLPAWAYHPYAILLPTLGAAAPPPFCPSRWHRIQIAPTSWHGCQPAKRTGACVAACGGHYTGVNE